MLSGKHECYCCGEVFEDFGSLRSHEREDHAGTDRGRKDRDAGDDDREDREDRKDRRDGGDRDRSDRKRLIV